MKFGCAALLLLAAVAAASDDVHANVEVDVSDPSAFKPFKHYWKRSFGSGHAALTVRPDWQAHLKQAVADLDLRGVRYHGIFDDDMGPVVPTPATLQVRDAHTAMREQQLRAELERRFFDSYN